MCFGEHLSLFLLVKFSSWNRQVGVLLLVWCHGTRECVWSGGGGAEDLGSVCGRECPGFLDLCPSSPWKSRLYTHFQGKIKTCRLTGTAFSTCFTVLGTRACLLCMDWPMEFLVSPVGCVRCRQPSSGSVRCSTLCASAFNLSVYFWAPQASPWPQ